jgi:hypothetical protein
MQASGQIKIYPDGKIEQLRPSKREILRRARENPAAVVDYPEPPGLSVVQATPGISNNGAPPGPQPMKSNSN